MKNFTKQNFKTNPLWIRLLIMTFMLLAGAGTAWGKTIYLDVTKNWNQGGATFGVHAWGAGDEDKMMSLVSGNIYKVDIKDGQTNVIFLRMNNSNSFDWSKEWNRVETTFVNGKDLFTITDWGAGTWSTYTPPCIPATITWGTISATMSKGSTQTISTTLTSGAGSVTYTSSDENVITVSGAKLTAVGNGTATITAKHSTVSSGYCTAQSIVKSVTVSTVIPSGTKLYFDFSKATAWGTGHYLSIVAAANSSYTANNSNTAGANSYKPKSDATWVSLTKECDGIYSYTTTSDISTGISLWSTNESSYDQVWQTDVILNIKASEFNSAKRCYTLGSTSTYNSGRQTDCFGGSWGSTIPVCCTPVEASQYTIDDTEYTWDGNAKKPTVTANTGAGTPTSTVYKQGNTEVENPTNVGTYDVYVSSNDGTTYCGANNLKVGSFEIKCKEGAASSLYTLTIIEFEYNGAPRHPGINVATGAGTVASTVYKQGNTEVASPINVGSYDVYITSNAGTGYCAITTLTKIGSYEIKCKTATASQYTISPKSYTYDGSAKKPTVSKASGATAAGEVTSTVYKQGDTTVDNPINAGTYDIYITTEAGTGYCALTNFKLGSFTINGKDPVESDFTYTNSKNYTGTVLSADVAWKTGLAAGTGGAITTYYKKKDAADNTYTTTKPSAVGVYTIAVTTVAGGNYAAATTKIVLGDFTINEVCDPITSLTWSITSGSKTTYCSGDKVQVTMTYNGTTANSYSRSGNHAGNIDFNASSLASGVVYTFTIINSGTISLTLTGCDGKTATTPPLTFNVMEAPATPTVKVVNNIIKCGNDFTQYGKIQITNYNPNYSYKIGVNNDPLDPSAIDVNGNVSGLTLADKFTLYAINSCGVATPSAQFEITETNNKPTITGNNSFQPGGSTTLTSDKGASTTWLALDGGDLNTRTGASVVFTAKDKDTYHVQATYNGCSTTYTIKVQDDLYVWVRRPIKKETAYDQFYHKNQNSKNAIGGDLFYKEFASLPGDYQQYNQGGKAADDTCTDKDGYTWYGFVVSKEAIENNYYFTVHAPNDGGEQGDAAKYNGFYTHTYATQLVDMDADLYFVMDETESSSSRGWNINTPVVVRASGDAKFNSNNFADFVPLYVKDANICGKEVVSFEWQKSDSQNGTYTTYNGKSGEGINNIRTREAGWYRCVVTYGDGKGTATSNAIQVTNTTSGTPGELADFSSKLPVIMVNTNGVGFPSDKNLATKNTKCASGKRYPSLYADDLKEKVTVDVIIKKGNEILYDRKARMNYRGSSSLNFKKKSYAFCSAQDSCVFDKGRHDYVKTKKAKMLNILGLDYAANDKDWVLYAATPDPSMMRNRLVFDLYQQMRPNDWGVHSTYVELIVDGEYRGVYVFMDKITANEKRVNITNENGFIVKFDKTDVVDRVENAEGDQKTFATSRTGTKSNENGIESYGACIDQRFEIEYPEKEDIEDAGGNWEAFYTKVQKRFEDFETALAAQKYDEVRTIIDYDSWADWFIISEFIKNQDGFRASNLFVYNGGKIMAMPLWDQELSMDNRTRIAHGSNITEGLLTTTASVYTDAFPATFWFTGGGANITGGLLNDPCFVSLVKEKWASYQLDALSASNITTLVNKYHAELDDNIRNREETKWPYTEASRGKTTDGDYMGYYAEGDATHYNYQTSKQAIIDFAGGRSTELGASTKGLGQALYGLNGKALIFTISPSLIETTPWQPSIFTVNAPEGYVYTLDYSELTEADAIIKENGNVYTFKIPRPNDWGTGGNGEEKSVNYRVTATIDADGENSCGTQHANTATLNVEFSDVTEDCETPIEPQP